MSVEIKYGENTVRNLSAGQTAIFHCAGKTMDVDLVVTAPWSLSGVANSVMNIAYGNTAPNDSRKLWVKTVEPSSVQVKLNCDFVGNGEVEENLGTLPQSFNVSGSTAAVGTKIYVFGGTTDVSTTSALDYIQVFDIATYETKILDTKLNVPTWLAPATAVGSKIYVFGGCTDTANTYLADIQVFDTKTDEIEISSAKLPSARQGCASAAIGKNIYLFGGYSSSSSTSTHYKTVCVFNTETEVLTSLGNILPIGMSRICAVAIGTKIYLIGGSVATSTRSAAIYVFDSDTYEIQLLEDVELPYAMFTCATAVGSKIYIFGGYSGQHIKQVYVFDTVTNQIQVIENMTLDKATIAGACTINNKIYVVENTIRALNLSIELPENHLLIEASATDNIFNLLPNMEIGVKSVYRGNAEGNGEKVTAALYKNGEWVDI